MCKVIKERVFMIFFLNEKFSVINTIIQGDKNATRTQTIVIS